MSSTSSRKPLPKKLKDDLKNIPKFKPPDGGSARTVADLMKDSVERAMYDEIIGPLSQKHNNAQYNSRFPLISNPAYSYGPGPELTHSASNPPAAAELTKGASTPEFTTTLLIRLSDAEEEIKSLRRQLVGKMGKISSLEKENEQLRLVAEGPGELIDELDYLQTHNEQLEKQVSDMEDFLHDYGLEWVGARGSNDRAANITSAEGETAVGKILGGGNRQSPEVNFKAFAAKIEELNENLASEPSQVRTEEVNSGHTGARRARLVHARDLFETIRIAFYRNGLLIKRGPFRENGSPSYSTFTRDILDGYFPSEFREAYPDGVMFNLVDRHEVDYSPGRATASDGSSSQLTREQLLNKLPRTVIRNGNVILIRDDVEKLLTEPSTSSSASKSTLTATAGSGAAAAADLRSQAIAIPSDITTSQGGIAGPTNGTIESSSNFPRGGGGGGVIILKTPAARDTETLDDGKPAADVLVKPVATVQIKLIDGRVLIAKMYADDLIGDIKAYIREYLLASSTVEQPTDAVAVVDFELRSAYPPRVLVNSVSLRDANLVPNGTLHARK